MKLPPRPTRKHLPEGFDASNALQVKEVLNRLVNEVPTDFHSASRWFEMFCEASSAISEVQTLLEIQVQRNTSDKAAEESLRLFDENVLSQMLELRSTLIDIYLSSPWRAAMHSDDRGRIAADFRNRRQYSTPPLVELQLKENGLIRRYRQLMSTAVTSFRGRQLNVSVIIGKLNDSNADVRKDAFLSYWKYIKENEGSLQDLFDEILENRVKQAETVSAPSYTPLAFAELGRLDYGVDECTRFRNAIAQKVVPVVNDIAKYQCYDLHARSIKPWDLNAWPQLTPKTLPARGSLAAISDAFEKILHDIHPAFAKIFREMKAANLVDIEPRANKGAGAFCVTFQESGVPFIFGNFAGNFRDALTLVHEFGHALHGVATSSISNVLLRHPGLEFCEVASLGLEMLAGRYFKHWWPEPTEAAKAFAYQAFHALQFWPFMAMMDEFQHELYQNPSDRAGRNKLWSTLSRKYRGHVDWSGCEEFEELGWFGRQHIFTSPFYYIDYGIAQLGAIQLWQRNMSDPQGAVDSYIEGLSLGAQRSLPELFEATGLVLDFDGKGLGEVVQQLKKELMKVIAPIEAV